MKKKISFVGTGFFSQISHLINYANNKNVELFEICDLDQNLAEGIKKKFNFTGNIFSDYKKMSIDQTDGFIIIVQRRLTHDIANYFLKKNCNIFTEKPHCYNSKDFIKSIKFQKGVWLKGYVRRSDKAIVKLKNNFDYYSKDLGKLKSVNFGAQNGNSYLGSKHYVLPTIKKEVKTKKSDFPKFLKKKNYHLYDLYNNSACHSLDLFDFFNFKNFKKISSEISEDNFLIKFNCNFKDLEIPSLIHLSSSKVKKWNEKMEFFFENGQIIINFRAPLDKSSSHRVIINNSKKKLKILEFKKKWCFAEQSKHFIKLIKNKSGRNHPDSKDGLNSIIFYEKIWKNFM